ncbi:FtsW/RodA/SpoVE family cell cycle protein [Hippea maritima]|uniref:Probable peptidoglycan glycosyltransferase FtsW n=1 Tax=Hippea maritima (strain ATCC 700847 / DSM 10411 / MH2) TaxID=760142 RepID=F2LTV0_HIPMA|nr:FtsW/RodA/SpoVE family cell cycle protein [Hippea maritima]AEA34476.1 cell cycle protein [Hippea maritima DSM 10411]
MNKLPWFRPSFVVLPYFLLLAIGIVEVWSSSYYFAFKKFSDPNFFLKREIVFVGLSIASAWFFSVLNYRFLKRISLILVIFALFLLVFLHVDGVSIRGATRWLRIGGFMFEPSGFAQLALLIYIADFISRKQQFKDDITRGVIPVAVVAGIFFLLIAVEPDVGSAALLIFVFLAMIYVFGYKFSHILLLIMPAVVVMGAVIYTNPNKVQRLINFFVTGKVNYQVEHALVALGSGGMFGVGVAKGIYKSLFVPDSYNDFIMAGIGEDFGFLGVIMVILLLVFLLSFMFQLSFRCKDIFGKALSFGIGALLSFEAIMNLFSVYHIMPPKGITMPFLSYGGTSLLIDGVLVGIVLSIYKRCPLNGEEA